MRDVVVVGGSVAGAAVAGFLARAGWRVTVLDRAAFPRAKACGEGLLPPGAAVLERLGVRIPEAAPLSGIRFRAGGRTVWVPFPSGPGLAVSRWVLDQAIRARAAELGAEFLQARALRVEAGAMGSEGFRPGHVETDGGSFAARVVIGADGVQSVFHRALGLRVRANPGRVGFSTHWTGVSADGGVVDVVAFPGGELYLAPLGTGVHVGSGDGMVLAALLVDRKLGLERGGIEGFLRERFASRFGEAVRVGDVLGAYPLASRVDRVAGAGWLLVGDAAGAVDPISGQGMSLALCGAELAAQTVDRALTLDARSAIERPFSMYARRLQALKRPVERLTAGMLFMSRHPGVAHVALARESRLAPFMRVAAGEPGLLNRVVGF